MNPDILFCPSKEIRVNKSEYCPGQICGSCDRSPRPVADRETAHKTEAHPKADELPKMSEADTKMRMTVRDRLMAIARCPEYLKYQEALLESRKETDPQKKYTILKKIRFPWRDPLEFHYLNLPDGPGFDEIKKGLLERFEREAVVLVKEGQGPWGENGPIPNSSWTWNKGRVFMWLSIDLDKSDKELKKSFMEIVQSTKEDMYRHKLMKPGVSEGRTTRKKRDYDPWEIYDRHKEGLSLPEIARRKKGESGNTAYNDNLRASNIGVKRAYNKAVKMIQTISAEIESWFTNNQL